MKGNEYGAEGAVLGVKVADIPTFKTIEEIVAANAATGERWFSDANMGAFRARVGSTIYGGFMFVSSTRGLDGRRSYTVHAAHIDGKIGNVWPFGYFATRARAHGAAARLVRGMASWQGQGCPCHDCRED